MIINARASQSGNVLFLILIAVALFAALSFVVTQSSRGGGKGLNDEKAEMGAARIMQFVSLLRTEVSRLRMAGCAAENLDWRNQTWKRLDGTPSEGIQQPAYSPKAGCAVFNDRGGPVALAEFSAYAHPDYDVVSYRVKGGHGIVGWSKKDGAGTEASDIVVEFRGLDLKVCSILLDPKLKPALVDEGHSFTTPMNVAPPTFTGTGQIIDEPVNAGQFYVHKGISTNPGCDIGAVIFER